jgi:hypothetical protein
VSSRNSDQDQWLAQAAEALAEAERLAGQIAVARPDRDLTLAVVQAEIMGLRREIERIQRERAGERRREFHPDWLDSAWSAAR